MGSAFIAALGAVLAGMVGCSEDEPLEANVGGEAGGEKPDASRGRPEPRSVIDDLPTEGQYCAVVIDARCDGDEDCPDAQVCCGKLSGAGFHYEALGCAETCDGASGG